MASEKKDAPKGYKWPLCSLPESGDNQVQWGPSKIIQVSVEMIRNQIEASDWKSKSSAGTDM
jgi:hypothetical protein